MYAINVKYFTKNDFLVIKYWLLYQDGSVSWKLSSRWLPGTRTLFQRFRVSQVLDVTRDKITVCGSGGAEGHHV